MEKEILKEQVTENVTEKEQSKSDFDRESIRLNGKEAGEGFLDLTNGNYGFTHADTFGMGEVLDVGVAHIFDSRSKASEQEKVKLNDGTPVTLNKGGLGDGFRTNYNQFLIKDLTGTTVNDEVSERFIYVDGSGNKHIFEEKYFYKDDTDKKHYVQKDKISIDMDKNLSVEVEGKNYEVEKEVTDGNLKLVAKLDKFKGIDKINTEIEEIVQVKSQIKEIQEYIDSCRKQKYFNQKNKDLIGELDRLNGIQRELQIQGVKHERIDLTDQFVLKKYEDAYEKTNDEYVVFMNKKTYGAVMDKTSASEIEPEDKELWNEYQAVKAYNDTQKQLRDINNYIAKGGEYNSLKDNKYTEERDFEYNIRWDPDWEVGEGNRLDRAVAINQLQLPLLEDLRELDKNQINFQNEKFVYENKQIDSKLTEYKEMLAKKQQELKELERQVPVHYIIDEDGIFMGFGKTNPGSTEENNIFRLIVIGDSYENTVFVSYDEKAEEQNRIVAITHSNNKQIDFEYVNGKLIKIINSFGSKTEFKYFESKLESITNADEITRFLYNDDDLTAVIDKNGDGLIMAKDDTSITIQDITKNDEISADEVVLVENEENSKNKLNIDNVTYIKYNKIAIKLYDMAASVTDEKGNVTAYTFNKNGETLAKVTTNSNNKIILKEFNYIGENCTFTASPNLYATEYFKGIANATILSEQETELVEYEVQDIEEINESKVKEFVFSAFATASSNEVTRTCSIHDNANITNDTRFELRAEVSYADNSVQEQYCSFDWKNKDEQYLAFPVSLDLDKTLTGIKLIFDYSNNTGEASIRGMSFREGTWVHKTLGEDKQVTEIKTSNGEVETLTYDKKRLVKATLVKNNETKIATFEYNKNGELTRATDYNGIVTEKEFNDKGEIIKTSKYNKNEPATRYVEETILDEKGREVKSVNELGEEVEGNGVSATNYNNTAVEISSAVDGEDNSNVLSYTLGMLTKVSHNGFDWDYTYDYKKRLTKVDLCGQEYLTKAYEEVENLDKTTTTLANNEKFIETLDTGGNVTKVEYENEGVKETLVENEYNDFGKLTKTTENGVETNITYDKFGNVKETNGTQNKKTFVVSGEYDKDKIKSKSVTIGSEVKTTNFAYDSQDRLSGVELPNGKKQSLTYDGLGRIKSESVGEISKNIFYVKKGERTCNLVSSVDYAIKDKTTNNTKYVYDKSGNITEVKENGKLVNRYEYDTIGRLVREDNRALNKTITYEYDKGGNIRRRFEHLFTLLPNAKLEEITCILKKEENKNVSWDSQKVTDLEYDYSYKTNGNNDQLLEYCGKKFEYDKIGNPVVYMDKALKFTKGRELVGFDYNVNNGTSRLEFKYNANGLRTQKLERNAQTGNTFITDYYLDGKNIVREERSRKYDNGTLEGGKTLVRTINYTYGASGLVGFSIKNDTDTLAKEYLYVKNIQGDIIGIVDLEGNEIAKYDYSAFGKQKVCYKQNGTWVEITSEAYNDDKNYAVAVANPFRYRGYYFDTETNLYYLRSRYYDPELCRFVTIDDISYIDTETINGINLYAYCGNNPVMCVDENGNEGKWWEFWKWDWTTIWVGVGMIVTAVTAVTISVLTFGAATPLAMGIIAGITIAAGVLTGINGIATIVEGINGGYNFMRDGLFNSVFGFSDNAYNWYAGIVEGVAAIGTIILGIYQSTGRFKAEKFGREYLGKGYKKYEDGIWRSKDGTRQLRWDKYGHGKNGPHFNLERWRYPLEKGVRNVTVSNLHIYYKWFKTWIKGL